MFIDLDHVDVVTVDKVPIYELTYKKNVLVLYNALCTV